MIGLTQRQCEFYDFIVRQATYTTPIRRKLGARTTADVVRIALRGRV